MMCTPFLNASSVRIRVRTCSTCPQHRQHALRGAALVSAYPSQHHQLNHLKLQLGPCTRPFHLLETLSFQQHVSIRVCMWRPVVRCQAEVAQHDQDQDSTCTVPALSQDGYRIEQHAQVHHPGAKIVGLGARGISSVNSLAATGYLSNSLLWAIDSDGKGFTGLAAGVCALEVGAGDDVNLSPEHLAALSGVAKPDETGRKSAATSSSHQAHATPLGSSAADMQADGSAGPAFVLGSAAGSPGGATLMLQLVSHLRRCGSCVVVALTRPFTFEGPRKLEQADTLIEALEDVAHLVVVVDQGVLTRAAADLTMQSASAIADMTLQHTVRSLMWALQAPEVLKLSADGTFQWHGRDLRLMKRPLFPPMMSLFTCPGHAYLGRGQAAVPASQLHISAAQLPSMLSTLAEDATRAAAESPFLDDKLHAATAVLCVLIFPRTLLQPTASPLDSSGLPELPTSGFAYQQQQEYALRSAVQVAALAVKELAGQRCLDVVVCPQVEDGKGSSQTMHSSTDPFPQAPIGSSAWHAEEEVNALVSLECALLVLNQVTEATSSETKESGLTQGSVSTAASRLNLGPAASINGSTKASAGNLDEASRRTAATANIGRVAKPGIDRAASAQQTAAGLPQPPPAGTRTKQPAWQAMSMIAGASASAAHKLASSSTSSSNTTAGKVVANNAVSRQRAGPLATDDAAAAAARAARRLTPFTPTQQKKQQPRAAAVASSDISTPAAAVVRPHQHNAPRTAAERELTPNDGHNNLTNSSRHGAAAAGAQADQQASLDAAAATGKHLIPRVSGSMATFMVAQSLDLPPRAAQWRHQQRSGPELPSSSMYQVPEAQTAAEEDVDIERERQEALGQSAAQVLRRPPLAAALLGLAGTVPEVVQVEMQEEETAGQDLKSRVAGMLDKERQYD